MEPAIVKKLTLLNQDFYKNVAREFSATREFFQPGWQRFWKKITCVKSSLALSANLKILDIGCGNGRFLDFLQMQIKNFQYLGIDGNPELLKIANKRLLTKDNLQINNIRFLQKNISADDNWLKGFKNKYGLFDIIVCFALLHHIPGFQNRLLLLQNLRKLLIPGGYLALSLWNFESDARFLEHIISWKDSDLQISVKQLESQDFLLTWGNNMKTLRYCHNFTKGEANRIVSQLTGKGRQHSDYFKADGKNGDLNHYLIFQAD